MKHPGLVVHASRWGSFTTLATDEVVSVEPAPHQPPAHAHIDTDAILNALSSSMPLLSAGMWPPSAGASKDDIGSDYSHALFPRDLFISLRSLTARYPLKRFLPVIDEVFRQQGRTRDEAIDSADYVRRNEAPGKLFHEHRDPDDPLAGTISDFTGCAWPWFAADDVTGDGANYLMELALTEPSLLERRVAQPDGREITYRDGVVAALEWQLRRLEDSGRHLILSTHLRRPKGSTWMPPIGSVWKDSPDGFVRADGTLPTRPVALVEVQCILYRSLRLASRLGLYDGEALAEKVRSEFFETFWVDDEAGGFPGYFAELDESGEKLVVVPLAASSLIDTLASGLLDGPEMTDRLHAVMRHLYDPALGLRGALGVRSLSTTSPHYYPSGGDKGAIWPCLNDRLATAAEERGFHHCAHHDDVLTQRICTATSAVPEFVPDADEPGFDRVRVKVWRARPDRYLTTAIEPAKPWQLWSLGAFTRATARAADFDREQPRAGALDAELVALAARVL